MRIIAYTGLVIICQIYGLAFDLLLGGGLEGALCDLLRLQTCAIPARAEFWVLAAGLLLVLPAACYYLYRWFSRDLRFARATAFIGLLLVTP